ncbi:MAG TPA: diacylglycerol kinase family protein [Candidatus Paceibacterota bacterium]|nr:diacylglycerol kinase family protein [Candidatus Paceibacterota bacterium]
MDSSKTEQETFSLVKRAKSFTHAWRGICIVMKTTHNAWIQLTFLVIAAFFGMYFKISTTDWLLIALAAALVLCAEAFNTAIEIDIDLTSPDYHPYARDTKDVAAGAVLLAAIAAAVIGLVIFVPHLLSVAEFIS